MSSIQVRVATPKDLPSIIRLEHHYQTNYVWQMERNIEEGKVSVSFRESRLPRPAQVDYPHSAELLKTNWRIFRLIILAEIDEVITGYLTIVEQPSVSTAWVHDLLIGEKYRRQGVGSALLYAAQEWMLDQNYFRILLEMQLKNYPAIKFALKHGYEFCGYNDHYFPNHDIAIFFARYIK